MNEGKPVTLPDLTPEQLDYVAKIAERESRPVDMSVVIGGPESGKRPGKRPGKRLRGVLRLSERKRAYYRCIEMLRDFGCHGTAEMLEAGLKESGEL